ncbi:hypothetical protein Q8A67_021421 [Cirrhinus molitorella]|uniref:Uncharacterized protein n=1 Tax=Cirrhinus molitorella TaxID=172907 RepID=A0AA88P6Y5_9TELE|nr:hypothetical protein Q8A67_021421 [Cirrhinus molitorella]
MHLFRNPHDGTIPTEVWDGRHLRIFFLEHHQGHLCLHLRSTATYRIELNTESIKVQMHLMVKAHHIRVCQHVKK